MAFNSTLGRQEEANCAHTHTHTHTCCMCCGLHQHGCTRTLRLQVERLWLQNSSALIDDILALWHMASFLLVLIINDLKARSWAFWRMDPRNDPLFKTPPLTWPQVWTVCTFRSTRQVSTSCGASADSHYLIVFCFFFSHQVLITVFQNISRYWTGSCLDRHRRITTYRGR